MQLGFIGLGAMGLPMTRHLLEAGHHVAVASRSRGPVERAVGLGAVDAGSAAEVASASEMVILCVPSSPQVIEVVGRPAAGTASGSGGGGLLDHRSGGGPGRAPAGEGGRRRLSRRPPLGRYRRGGGGGTLTVMVGGEGVDARRGPPRPRGLRRPDRPCGRTGDGPGGQALQQFDLCGPDARHLRGHRAAVKSGVDLAKFHDVLLHSTGDCVAVRTRLPVAGVVAASPASNGWRPGFMTDLMAKDLDLALGYGAGIGVPLGTAASARQALTAAIAAGYGREDFSAVAKIIFDLSGLA